MSGGSGPPTYDGWYCQLFYKGEEDSFTEEYLVADVHTNPPSDLGPGTVLQQGVGKINLMTISINSGSDKTVYVGPVFSHYEFLSNGVKRLSDSEWTKLVELDDVPDRPQWNKDFLVKWDPNAPFNLEIYHSEKKEKIVIENVRVSDSIDVVGQAIKKKLGGESGYLLSVQYSQFICKNTTLKENKITRRKVPNISLTSIQSEKKRWEKQKNWMEMPDWENLYIL